MSQSNDLGLNRVVPTQLDQMDPMGRIFMSVPSVHPSQWQRLSVRRQW